MKLQFDKWLTEAYHQQASDIHLTIGKAPIFRINGNLIEQDMEKLRPTETKQIVYSILSEEKWKQLERERELDFSYGINGVSRFRINTFYQRGELSLAIRIVPRGIPSIDELGLPPILKEVVKQPQGLVLVTGPTGSGKSTTLASMIDHLNHSVRKHIITLEDPIEYMHRHRQSVIDQREVGIDTANFANGLRASLRQDPDIILVGEMRDLETISTAITAAETGHLVLGTLHTKDAVSTIERIIDVFPPEQQAQIRIQLSTILSAVISQRLLITKDRQGRKVATEIMISTSAVKNLIRNEKLHQLQNVLQTSRELGMHTLEMDLKRLVHEGQIAYETAAPFLPERSY
ncbi:PilT/PilU family type 4a pilus ATPase [Virgibacillus halodenitrificans]|uniref:type IV pilus twitching motility protein PilT n=1 Tax=Virgibacillus halodenitrificans TaxID=1482 RepID=UPI00136CC1AA|nr:type IV pilus twitching motility protein PilT [Virgibacillus halodenitrificans]MCJ0931750.1 type IV pilus twitching motility protein PilT [Virgibacillus halodenitrificans]MYL44796.1 PilT/PilU family type 4a pilus ATPase [Virgibacillus halodenitrificans]